MRLPADRTVTVLPDETPDEAAFRSEARQWLQTEARRWRADVEGFVAPGALPEAELLAAGRSYQQALAAAGLAGISWPVEFGGRGLTVRHEVIWLQESAPYDLPVYPFLITLGMCAPTLMAHGTAGQRAHVPAMLRGEELWCQLFSEPGAGSDLASLQTRAAPTGDGWRLTGQKVWASWAHRADHAILLGRTDPEAPKHRGLTMFAVDLGAPGVVVRPLRQMTGEAFFNEVFLDDVTVAADAAIGEVGDGWRVALTTLMNERAAVGARTKRGSPVRPLLRLAAEQGRTGDPLVRQRLAGFVSREAVLTLLGERVIAALIDGREPGPEGSLAKLASARLGLEAGAYAVELAGPAGVAWATNGGGGEWARNAAGAFGPAIGGGTAEIMRNILGERVLGLPKEPSPSRKDLAAKGASCTPKT